MTVNTSKTIDKITYRIILFIIVPLLMPCVLLAGAWQAAEKFIRGAIEAWRYNE